MLARATLNPTRNTLTEQSSCPFHIIFLSFLLFGWWASPNQTKERKDRI